MLSGPSEMTSSRFRSSSLTSFRRPRTSASALEILSRVPTISESSASRFSMTLSRFPWGSFSAFLSVVASVIVLSARAISSSLRCSDSSSFARSRWALNPSSIDSFVLSSESCSSFLALRSGNEESLLCRAVMSFSTACFRLFSSSSSSRFLDRRRSCCRNSSSLRATHSLCPLAFSSSASSLATS